MGSGLLIRRRDARLLLGRLALLASLAATSSGCHPREPEKVELRQAALVTPTFIQTANAVPQNSPTSVGVAFTGAQTAGDLNVVIIGWNNSTSNVTSVT